MDEDEARSSDSAVQPTSPSASASDLDDNKNSPDASSSRDPMDTSVHNTSAKGVEIDASNPSTWKDLVFDSYEDVYKFYRIYGMRIGFGVKKRYSNYRRGYPRDLVYYIKLECLRAGAKVETKKLVGTKYRPRPSRHTKNGCEAYLVAEYDLTGSYYKIKRWEDKHNHDFIPSEYIDMVAQNRRMCEARVIVNNSSLSCGIPVRSTFDHMSDVVGGEESIDFVKPDVKSQIDTKKQKEMQPGDGVLLNNWLREQSMQYPGYYYDLQFDSSETISSVFWADSRMRSDYLLFGDFVSFDTTFRSDKEQRPLGIFVGLNHHYDTVVFGAALLYDETAPSFEWLFQTFLTCMKGKRPLTLMTDQGPAIELAAKNILPTTYHALCSWHICQNAKINLGSLATEMFWDELHQLIGFVDSEKEFEHSWNNMLAKCFSNRDSSEIKWLELLYSNRMQWSYAWVKNHFTAGKSTTQLREQFGAFARNFLSLKQSIVTFLSRFQAMIDDLRYIEMRKDFSMMNSIPHNPYKKSKIMLHAAKTYTPKIFELLHQEFDEGQNFSCRQNLELVNGSLHVFDVVRPESLEDPLSAIVEEERVEIDYETLRIVCSCRFFENWWFPCRHILRAMDCLSGFGHQFCDNIPNSYIINRWCRNCKDSPIVDKRYAIPKSSCFGDRYQSFLNLMVDIGSKICTNEKACNRMVRFVLSGAAECDSILRSSFSEKNPPTPSQVSTFILHDVDIGNEDVEKKDSTEKDVDSIKEFPTGRTFKKKARVIEKRSIEQSQDSNSCI